MHPPENMVHQKKHTLEDFGKDRKDEQKIQSVQNGHFWY